jgi:AraC-like DNA-binding protein
MGSTRGTDKSCTQELFALRRALWEVAERVQRAIAQFDTYFKAHVESDTAEPTETADGSATARGDARLPTRNSPRDLLTTGPALRAALPPDHSRAVARALRHMELHFDKPIGLVRLARVAGCSRSTLTRTFRREMGQTVHAYLVGIRLARAAAAMAQGEKIEVVMLSVGFHSKRNFYRLFKSQFGLTPAQFGQIQSEQGGESP